MKYKYVFVVVGILIISATFLLFDKKCAYTFLNNDFVCNERAVINKKEYSQLKHDIEQYIDMEKKVGEVTNVSVYFRDLVNGPVMGINEFDDFSPASLLKLPLSLVYFMEKDAGSQITFDKSIIFSRSGPLPTQRFVSSNHLVEGETYTIEDLLRRMISYSDNEASTALSMYLEKYGRPNAIKNTFLELGIILTDDPYDKSISVRRYASLFRGLYNASLISGDDSEKLLSWLSQSDFKNGLAAELPREIVVAHKFGERDLKDNTKQLHDCGIIYYPKNPYLLCVMTHGSSYDSLGHVIQHISGKVYKEVDSRKL